MTSCLLYHLGRTVWKGHTFSSLFYGKDTKSLGKRPRFATTLSNTLAFTCPRGYAGSALKENRLYVSSQSLRPTSKLESFGELQISVKSGSLTTPFWPNPSMKSQGGKREPLAWGREQEEAFKEIKGLSPMPLL
jgi:hypothetical protein